MRLMPVTIATFTGVTASGEPGRWLVLMVRVSVLVVRMPAEPSRHRELAFAAAMRPFSTGAAYLNFTPEADRVRDAYGDAKYARLVALKDRHDPANLFRLNQNIQPGRAATEPVLA